MLLEPYEYYDALNAEGYAFQHAARKLIEDTRDARQTPWYFVNAEYPVSVKNRDTQIDLLLRRVQSTLWMVVECKRVDRTRHDWLFARAPKLSRGAYQGMTVERFERGDDRGRAKGVTWSELTEAPYHVGISVGEKKKQNENEKRAGTGQIYKAAGQACLGVSGLVEQFLRCPSFLGKDREAVILPVIFTTARLLTIGHALDEASLETGKLPTDAPGVEEVPWLYYQHVMSHSGKYHIGGHEDEERDYIRTVTVVSSKAISDFLKEFFAGEIWEFDPLKFEL